MRVRSLGAAAATALALATALAACGTSGPPPSAAPPVSSGAPAASGVPRPTPWLGNAVLGIEAMGLADAEIRKGINDFNAGVQTADPQLMLRAASGLKEVDVLVANADRIEPYPPMSAFARDYRAVVTDMAAAAEALEAALEGGDAAATTAASRDLVATFTRYAELQPQLADWVVQVPNQKRILVR